MTSDYLKYTERMKKIADVSMASAVLSWDQEVYMPPKGAMRRAGQLSTLSGIGHEMFTSEETGELLKRLADDPSLDEIQKLNIKRTRRDYDKKKKLPKDFVELLSRTVSESFNAWQKARQENNYSLFAPLLGKLVTLKRQECELIGYRHHPYDALLDEYEPDLTVKELDALFSDVRSKLLGLLNQIKAAPRVNHDFLFRRYEKQKQWDLSLELLKQMHYDFEAGRQDISPHPFTISFSPEDVRVTTRIDEHNLAESIWSTIHECGHALYEQGLPPEAYGLPQGEACSLGIHESQSRLWENNIGRSLAFCKAYFPLFQKYFPENLSGMSTEDFFRGLNLVRPSEIRVRADELTYHFHILIRYEIEKALMEKEIETNDLPAFWNSRYEEYLGVIVPSDDKGVLQDIHWSHGGFGYFPTYSLGSFYAAQFFYQAKKEIPGLEDEIEKRNMSPLLKWLREKIHVHGRLLPASALCEKITGEKLNFNYFMDYAAEKYSSVYNINLTKAATA